MEQEVYNNLKLFYLKNKPKLIVGRNKIKYFLKTKVKK